MTTAQTIAPKMGILFGLTPPPLPGKIKRPVPHEAFGLCTRHGSTAARQKTRERLMSYVLGYLREHGGMNARDLAEVFGVDAYIVGADMGVRADRGLVTCDRVRATSIWRAL